MGDNGYQMEYGLCPSWALSLGYLGVASGAVLSNWGSAWGTWKSGVSLLNTGIRHPSSVMKNVIPVVMAGVIGIYGLIVAVILAGNIDKPTVGTNENVYSVYTGMAHLAAGLCCGLSGLAAGGCIGIIGDYGVRSVGYRTSNISVVFSTNDKGGGFDAEDDAGGTRKIVRRHVDHADFLGGVGVVRFDCCLNREPAQLPMRRVKLPTTIELYVEPRSAAIMIKLAWSNLMIEFGLLFILSQKPQKRV
eukprot:CAMPEP_0181093720 /NCGR_PEP_ID=MMETSP1071-20121207/9602_1 /TAXON_ID=35127 /ORGANISM="Thalassiosira sp., Strain NH16" /LENGTH=246 /DNA_ID=CAMNT_0023175985 /DNA_START=89 /DNA_END=830 /DNA_ORIENTATION=+